MLELVQTAIVLAPNYAHGLQPFRYPVVPDLATGTAFRFGPANRMLRRHRPQIEAAIPRGPVQRTRRVDQHQDCVLTRGAFGFHSAEALIPHAMVSLGGYRPDLPGRS